MIALMVLLCYGGPDDAKAAIGRAADRPVIVVPSAAVTEARPQRRRERHA
jgi:hypothetical protein